MHRCLTRRNGCRLVWWNVLGRTMLTAAAVSIVGACPWSVRAAESEENPLVSMVVDLLGEDDPDMHALAFEQIRSDAPGEAATLRFVLLLPELTPGTRARLVDALGDRGDPIVRPAMLVLAEHSPHEAVRAAAIRALGQLGRPEDVPPLVRILAEGPAADRLVARGSLMGIQGDKAASAIAGALDSASPEVQVELLDILAERRALNTRQRMVQAALGDESVVRGAAMRALAELAGPEHIEGMVHAVLRAEEGRERDAAEKSLMIAWNRIESDRESSGTDSPSPLLEAVAKLDPDQRVALLPALGRIGEPSILPTLDPALADPDAELHEVAVRALCNWPNSRVADRLIELVTSGQHEGHRIAALRALMRIAPLEDGRTDAERLELLKKAMSLATRPEEVTLALDRARTIRTMESLRFIEPYMDDPKHKERACLSVVELAHYRDLLEPNKEEFFPVLDRVIEISEDPVTVERARRYKRGETWVRPK